MSKGFSIFLSFYILIGTLVLPKGDFSFTTQVSRLYDLFVQLNGPATFDEFLGEELFEPYSPPEDANEPGDEPNEKECHPVPIDLITVNASISFYNVASIIEIPPEPIPTTSYIPYTENYTNFYFSSIFHPPRVFSLS